MTFARQSSGAIGVSVVSAALGGALACLTLFGEAPVPEKADEGALEAPRPPALLLSEDDDESACQITVRALSADGTPAENARLHLASVGADRSLGAPLEVAPRAGGVFRFTQLPRGTFHLSVLEEGAEGAAPPAWECRHGGERAFFEVELAPARARVAGRITGRGGTAVPATELLFEQPEGRKAGLAGVLHVPVDATGRFELALAPGRYHALALAPHHISQRQEITVVEGRRVELALKLPWRPEASGVVVDGEGRPLAGAQVFAGPLLDPKVPPNGVVTDAEGRFVLPVVAGAPVVLAARSERGLATVSLPPVRSLEGHSGLRLQVSPGRTVDGWVQRRDGRPLAFGEVQYRVRALGLVGSAATDAEGHFSVAGMPRGHDVELWARGSAIGAWGAQVATPEQSRVLLTYVPPAF